MQENFDRVDPGLNQAQLAYHLSVNRSKVDEIVRNTKLEPILGFYPWRRIFHCIHRIDYRSLSAHLAKLQVRHSALPHMPSLQAALQAPLETFEELAYRLGRKSDTLSKAIRQGRISLPIAMLVLGPRIKRFRPIEVELWLDHGIMLDLPILPAAQEKAHSSAFRSESSMGLAKSRQEGTKESDPEKKRPAFTTGDFFAAFGPEMPLQQVDGGNLCGQAMPPHSTQSGGRRRDRLSP